MPERIRLEPIAYEDHTLPEHRGLGAYHIEGRGPEKDYMTISTSSYGEAQHRAIRRTLYHQVVTLRGPLSDYDPPAID